VCCKTDVERGLYCCSLNKYLTFQNELSRAFEPLTIVPRNTLARKELRADQLASLNCVKLNVRMGTSLRVQINLQPDFERIRSRAP
jgi:hypothetical protein